MRNQIILVLFFVVVLLVSAKNVVGAEVTIGWQPPTEYEDATPLPLTEIERYQLACVPTTGQLMGFDDPPPNANIREWFANAVINNERVETYTVPGQYFCGLRVICIATDCQFSAWSNEVNFSIGRRTRPPVAVTIAVTG